MDKTNYSLLSIVGIVAITAIIAMFLHADRSPIRDSVAAIDFVDSTDAGLTGNIILEGRTRASAERPRPDFDWTRYDYDSNGALDTDDAVILASVTKRARFCPANKICDVDQNGLVELNDLGLFNAKLLAQAMVQEASRSALTGFVATDVPSQRSSANFWTFLLGTPVQ